MKQLGWNQHFQTLYPEQNDPGRIIQQNGHQFIIENLNNDIFTAELNGKLLYEGSKLVIGDWVIYQKINTDQALITNYLERFSCIKRKVPGAKTEEQLIAANIDYIAITQGLDGGRNFNKRSIERYLTMAWDSGAKPVLILNKIDKAENIEFLLQEAESVAPDIDIILTSAIEGQGLERLYDICGPGKTLCFVGPSGVGKSSIINSLLKNITAETGTQRSGDLQGRHTTTNRSLYHLERGGMLVDVPGLRELQLWSSVESLDHSFEEIKKLAEECKFRDCSHTGEPGCAVQRALRDGGLDYHRYESYLELKKEINYLDNRKDQHYQQEEKKKWKQISKFAKQIKKNR